MNKIEARKLAETATMEQIRQMLKTAQETIKDWTQVSSVNIGLTKGVSFNIFSAGDLNKEMHIMGKTNAIREFGEFFPGYQKIAKTKKDYPKPSHQEPKFIDWL